MALYIPEFGAKYIVRAAILSIGCFLIMAYIFVYNDWADFSLDDTVAGQRKNTFVYRGIAPRQMLLLTAALALSGAAIISLVSIALLPIALAMIALGIAYSLPVAGLKGKAIPIYASALHFVGILLVFLFGAMAFGPLDARAWQVGSYFGLVIMAGHLVQEVQDFSGDQSARVTTTAVRFGKRRMFALSFGLFSVSFAVLYLLADAGAIPSLARYALIFYPVYAWWALRAWKDGLQEGRVRRLRNQYRVLFAVMILAIAIAALVQKPN